jgi:ABC-type cobalamin transport system permease subunit
MASEKPQFSPDTIEFNHEESSVRTLRKSSTLDTVRRGLTLLTLLVAVSIVGMSGNALAVYNQTHVAKDFYLPLWPYNFNLSPNIALVVGSSVATLCDAISLAGSKIPAVRYPFMFLP